MDLSIFYSKIWPLQADRFKHYKNHLTLVKLELGGFYVQRSGVAIWSIDQVS